MKPHNHLVMPSRPRRERLEEMRAAERCAILAYITDHPGCKGTAIARHLGRRSCTTLHPRLGELQDMGLIVKTGNTNRTLWYPSAAAGETPC